MTPLFPSFDWNWFFIHSNPCFKRFNMPPPLITLSRSRSCFVWFDDVFDEEFDGGSDNWFDVMMNLFMVKQSWSYWCWTDCMWTHRLSSSSSLFDDWCSSSSSSSRSFLPPPSSLFSMIDTCRDLLVHLDSGLCTVSPSSSSSSYSSTSSSSSSSITNHQHQHQYRMIS